jgi:hypothetical protein
MVPVGLAVALAMALSEAPAAPPGERVPAPKSAKLIDSAPARAALLERLGVDRWHAQGLRGAGVKVAILDSGFADYQAHLGTSLPPAVETRSFRKDRNLENRDNPHGVLCAEVIHTLAPATELLFANWEPDSPQSFLDAVRWARRQGAQVISCSVIVPSWSDGNGGGAIHDRLKKILGSDHEDEVLFFASAGNTAQRHWSGAYRPGKKGWHEWVPGQMRNRVLPWGNERVSVDLTAPAGSEFDLAIQDLNTGKEVLRGKRISGRDRCCVTARFIPQTGSAYGVLVTQVRPRRGSSFHLVVLGGGLKYARQRGSIPFPGDGSEIITVGAVDDQGRRLPYSSCGPNGKRHKPDLVAIVPFPNQGRTDPFTGTSAAAPQAAAIAALLRSRNPNWTSQEVRAALMRYAEHGDEADVPSYDTGFGLVRLPVEMKPARSSEPATAEGVEE